MFEQCTVVTGNFLNNGSSEKAWQSLSRSVKGSHIKMAFAENIANVFGFPVMRHAFKFLYGEIKETEKKHNYLPNIFIICNRCAKGHNLCYCFGKLP